MNRVIYGKATSVVRLIEPSELKVMQEDSIIIVNRIRVNSKLVEFEITNSGKQEILIITKAIKEMKRRETKGHRTVMGPAMRVGDVKKLFPEYEKLPRNSFALADV